MRRPLSSLTLRRLGLACLGAIGLAACGMLDGSATHPGYVVFFSERSAVLEADGASVVASAAAAARATPGATVAVLGWTDSDGSPAADIKLSQQRAKTVAAALVADGITADRITRQGRGQTHDDPGVESRRVEIRIGS